MSRWTHSICVRCWSLREGDKPPVTVIDQPMHICCVCGATHSSGIFVRGNPVEFRCKGEHSAEA